MKALGPVAIALSMFAAGPAAAEEPEGWYLDGPATIPDLRHQGPFQLGSDCLRARDIAESALTQKHIEHQPLQCTYLTRYYYLVESAEIAGESVVSGPYTTLDKCLEARAKQPGGGKPSNSGSLYYSIDCVRHYPSGN
jgi:hypothetical protein